MKRLCLLVLAVGFVACENDKITDVLQISNFYAVRIDPQSATLAQGSTLALTVTAYDATCMGANCNPLAPGNPIQVNGVSKFRSTDTTVARVDSVTGVVTAQAKAGTANIIGTLQNIPGGQGLPSVTFADTTPVTVLAAGVTPPAIGGMTLTSFRSTNGAGSTDTLTVTYTDAGGATVGTQRAATNTGGLGRPAFFTSDPSVATVGSTGIVTGIKPGTATIFASSTVGGVTKTASFPITITDPVTATISITTATSGTGIIFFPETVTVSATQAAIERRPNATTTGAVVTWGVFPTAVFSQTFTSTTTPNDTQCFNVTFTDPTVARAAPTAPSGSTVPAGNSGNIGTGGSGSANPPLCSVPAGNPVPAFGKDAQSRLFTTPGTYTFTSTTNGAKGTLIVK
ncbi:MAG: Ig domain-containing protein [Gemmatimonadaceae bacterium]